MKEYPTGYVPTPAPRLARGAKLYGQSPTFAATADLTRTTLLAAPPVVDQEGWGACVGNAVARAMMILHPNTPDMSRYWVWRKVCDMYNMGPEGGGIPIDAACDVAILGLPSEEDVPYPAVYTPVQDGYYLHDTILEHKLVTSRDPLQGVVAALQAGNPVIIGTELSSEEFYKAGSQNGVVTGKGTVNDFYHAMYVWGYDVENQLVLVRNSWGDWLDWQAQRMSLASPHMGYGDVAFTLDAFRKGIYEYRELTAEPHEETPPVEPEPTPGKPWYVTIDFWSVQADGNTWQSTPLVTVPVVPEEAGHVGMTVTTPYDEVFPVSCSFPIHPVN